MTERGISAVCPRWPPKAQTTPKLRGSSIFILSNDPCNRLQKTPSKTPQKRLLTTFQTQPRAVSRRTAKPSYAVEQRDQAKHPRTAKPGYTPSNNEKTWPPPPREARVSCPTSTWAQPSPPHRERAARHHRRSAATQSKQTSDGPRAPGRASTARNFVDLERAVVALRRRAL